MMCKSVSLCFLLIFGIVLNVYANSEFTKNNSVSLSSTRAVFKSGNTSEGLGVKNNSKESVYLIRSWIADYHTNKVDDSKFLITPPLLKIKPDSTYQLKINKISNDMPTDRESIYKINVMAIPVNGGQNGPSSSEISGGVSLSVTHTIKMFYRPESIDNKTNMNSIDDFISANYEEGILNIENKSPFFVTFANLITDKESLYAHLAKEGMVSPFGNIQIRTKTKPRTLTYQRINDFGGVTLEKIIDVK